MAWGPSADSRWKELVTVAEAEDAFMLEALGASVAAPPVRYVVMKDVCVSLLTHRALCVFKMLIQLLYFKCYSVFYCILL